MTSNSKHQYTNILTGTESISIAQDTNDGKESFDAVSPNYFVDVADIMGFKYLIGNSRDGSNLGDHMEKVHLALQGCTREIQRLWDIKSCTNGAPVRTRSYVSYGDSGDPVDNECYWESICSIARSMYFFSDTIFFCLKAKRSFDAQIVQLRAMCQVMNSIIVLPALYKKSEYQITNRGGIAYGPAYINSIDRIFFGDPVINAYELSEAQQWMGAALHSSVNNIASHGAKNPHHLVGFDSPLVRYNVPLKRQYRLKNRDIKYALNWYQSHRALPEYCPEIREHLNYRPLWRDIMDGNILHYDWEANDDIRKKKIKTIAFAKKIEDAFNSSKKYRKIVI